MQKQNKLYKALEKPKKIYAKQIDRTLEKATKKSEKRIAKELYQWCCHLMLPFSTTFMAKLLARFVGGATMRKKNCRGAPLGLQIGMTNFRNEVNYTS